MHSGFCSNCGKSLPMGAAFCGDCGAPQKPPPVTPLSAVTPLTPAMPPPVSGGAALSADTPPSGDHARNQLPLSSASHAIGPMNPGGSGPMSGPYPPVSGPQRPMMPPPAYTPGPPPAVKPGNGGSSSGEKKTREGPFSFGNMMALGGLIIAIVGVLITLNVIRPFTPAVKPTPTLKPSATPNLQAFTDPYMSCRSDNTIDPNTIWINDGQNSTSYECNATGMQIIEQPKAAYDATVLLPLPLPHEPLTQDYSISVRISDLALPQSCAGVTFRLSQGTGIAGRGYGAGICLNGLWFVEKSFATTGNTELLNHGNYTINTSGSYLLSIEVSNEVANISVDGLSLPPVTLDPTFKDQDIGLFADGNDPQSTSIDPNTNPGASATFSQFTFQPID